jgi:hypothetical protein
VILTFKDKSISQPSDLTAAAQGLTLGESYPMTINREGTSPSDEGAIRDLATSYLRSATLAEAVGNFDGAVQMCEHGVAEFERLGKTPSLQAQLHKWLVQLEWKLGRCQESQFLAGPLESVQKRPVDRLPSSLRLRCQLLAARKDIEGVAATAAALRALQPTKAGNLYNAACGYGLCAKLAAGWPGAGPFHPANAKGDGSGRSQPRKADEAKYRQLAIDLLQQAATAGYLQMRAATQDQDLAALHELPEFKTLVSRSPKSRTPFGGG